MKAFFIALGVFVVLALVVITQHTRVGRAMYKGINVQEGFEQLRTEETTQEEKEEFEPGFDFENLKINDPDAFAMLIPDVIHITLVDLVQIGSFYILLECTSSLPDILQQAIGVLIQVDVHIRVGKLLVHNVKDLPV